MMASDEEMLRLSLDDALGLHRGEAAQSLQGETALGLRARPISKIEAMFSSFSPDCEGGKIHCGSGRIPLDDAKAGDLVFNLGPGHPYFVLEEEVER